MAGAEPAGYSRIIRRSPLYYGWVVLAVASFCLVMSSPGQSYAVSIFIEHFIRDLGLSRSVVSSLYTGATLLASVALPFIGRQIDRFGVRVLVGVVATVFGLGCLLMGQVQNVAMLGAGFLCIRLFGQGGMVLVSQNVINQWWVARRGMAMGISGMVMSLLGLGLFPVLVNAMIPHLGWRATYAVLGGVLLAVVMPLGLLFFRHRPEHYGLLPDGRREPAGADDASAPPVSEEDWTLPEAMRTPAFWIVGLSAGTISMLTTGLFFHIVSIFADSGLGPDLAAAAFVPVAITTAIVTLGSGVLVDRIPVRLLLCVALACQALSLVLALHLRSAVAALCFGLIAGTTSGLFRTISGVVWAAYYGRLHLGSITGVATTFVIAGSALGPMPFGMARDYFGSYEAVLYSGVALPVLLGIACLFIRRPTRAA